MFNLHFNLREIFSAFMVMFAVIDIIGSIPVIIDLKEKYGKINALKASVASLGILLIFFFLGEPLLNVFGVDIYSFAIAGSLVVFFVGLEMVLGVEIFKGATPSGVSIVPIAFPLVAGAGSITSMLSLKAEYYASNIIVALILNAIIVYLVIKSTKWFEKILGKVGILILRKAFGIILLAIAIKLFVSNTGLQLGKHI
mgnify:CR=1 FL=1